MARRIMIVLSLLLAVSAAHADTANVREGQSQLQFLPAAAPASGGATARPPASSDKEAMFRSLDIDGDGFISKAEAAGNEPVTVGFDRADRNHDGKLSFAEYDSIGKPRPARKKTARGQGSASAGASKKAN
jgi:EF hand domain-containing protein